MGFNKVLIKGFSMEVNIGFSKEITKDPPKPQRIKIMIGDSLRRPVNGLVWDSIRVSVWSSVVSSVEDSIKNSAERSVWDSVDDSVWRSISNSVWRSLKILLNPKELRP